MTLKNFLLITTNYHPEPTATGKFNGEMIEWLVKNGHNCTVITTFPHYPYWRVQAPYTNWWYKKEVKKFNSPDSGTLTVYRCPHFVPTVPTGIYRLLQEITFLITSLFVVFWLFFKKGHDFILAVAPPFHTAYSALLYRAVKRGKIIFHIQDLQIDTAEGLGMLKNKTLFPMLYKMEKYLLKKADYVSTISYGMINKIRSKLDRKVLLFPNWVDTEYFSPLSNREELKHNWGYSEDDFIILYSGGIGEKQGLDVIIHTANLLKDHNKYKFVICGFGQYKEQLEQLSIDLDLKNIDFLPLQDKSVFNEFLNIGDLHLVIQKSNASDLAMPSKLTNIMAIGGVPIVTAFPGTSLHDFVVKNNVGYVCDPDNSDALAHIIGSIGTDLESKRKNARLYAIERLNCEYVLNSFFTTLNIGKIPQVKVPSKKTPRIGVFIPSLNAGDKWKQLLESVELQNIEISRKIVVDSGSTDDTVQLAAKHGFEVVKIPNHLFNHGKTRQMLTNLAPEVEICVFLTQDSILATPDSIYNLVKHILNNDQVGMSFGRQLPHKNATTLETHERLFNYPDESSLRSLNDTDEYGFKVFFCSNSFAAYRRSVLKTIGGFPGSPIMGEDAIVAAKMLMAGYKKAYAADAAVYHSHSYSTKTTFQRYFDIRVFHEQNKWLITNFGKPTGEGFKFVLSELKYVFKHDKASILGSVASIMAKWMGYNTGRFYKFLPEPILKKISFNKKHWGNQAERTGKKEYVNAITG